MVEIGKATAGFGVSLLFAKVLFREIENMHTKEFADFQQIIYLGFCRSIFIGGNITSVEPQSVGQILLAQFEPLAQEPQVVGQKAGGSSLLAI